VDPRACCRPVDEERDHLIRLAAFDHLSRLVAAHGDVLPWRDLQAGFPFGGRTVRLIGPQGIFTPAGMEAPLSITTAPDGPYDDAVGDDGFLQYRYRGSDPQHRDNVGLLRAMERGLALVYFAGISRGNYQPVWPAIVQAADPGSLTFTIGLYEPGLVRPDLSADVRDAAQRATVTRLVVQKLRDSRFRSRVLNAYRDSCSVCRLHHEELLDGAHILPVTNPRSVDTVPNGLALCKLHHTAFDRNILGVRPDTVIEIRTDVLEEHDGPMLIHGLQGHHGQRLVLPHRPPDRPNAQFLEERYELFRVA
jgi:putative restriction endonuclease